MEQQQIRHLHIRGAVQGVGYRAGFAAQAQRLGLSGWVRNDADGSVEAVVCGNPDCLRQIIEWAWRGPRAAQVRAVQVTDLDRQADDYGSDFEIRPTR